MNGTNDNLHRGLAYEASLRHGVAAFRGHVATSNRPKIVARVFAWPLACFTAGVTQLAEFAGVGRLCR